MNKNNTRQWLLDRGISRDVLLDSGIEYDEFTGRIVIPVYNKNGEFLFNKYRRNPEVEDGPKYIYQKGASVSLYNIQKPIGDTVVICEGELDCLLINTLGLAAVSSTGGARSFQEDWALLFEDIPNVYICLDNDEAGVLGSLRIQEIIPRAKWVSIPDGEGKDATEFVKKNGNDAFIKLLKDAESVPVIGNLDIGATRKQLIEHTNKLQKEANRLLYLQRENYSKRNEALRQYHIDMFLQAKKLLVRNKYETKEINGLADIKNIPITKFLEFDRQGFAHCPWHPDKEASLKYNGYNSKYPNTVHCFGSCARTWDVIDVYIKLNNVTFLDAVKQLKDEAQGH